MALTSTTQGLNITMNMKDISRRRGSTQSRASRVSSAKFTIELSPDSDGESDYNSDSHSGGSQSLINSVSAWSADTSTPSPTAIGTPTEGLIKAGVDGAAASWAELPDPAYPPTQKGESTTKAVDASTRLTAPTPSPLLLSGRTSHLSHLSLPATPTGYPTDSTAEKTHLLESIHDLVSRVEAWRGGLACTGPTSIKRNKAYVGLWGLGVQDLLANPVLVTAMSSPAGSHFESRR